MSLSSANDSFSAAFSVYRTAAKDYKLSCATDWPRFRDHYGAFLLTVGILDRDAQLDNAAEAKGRLAPRATPSTRKCHVINLRRPRCRDFSLELKLRLTSQAGGQARNSRARIFFRARGRTFGRGYFHPSGLASSARLESFTGVYLPYWLFDANVTAAWKAVSMPGVAAIRLSAPAR